MSPPITDLLARSSSLLPTCPALRLPPPTAASSRILLSPPPPPTCGHFRHCLPPPPRSPSPPMSMSASVHVPSASTSGGPSLTLTLSSALVPPDIRLFPSPHGQRVLQSLGHPVAVGIRLSVLAPTPTMRRCCSRSRVPDPISQRVAPPDLPVAIHSSTSAAVVSSPP